MRPEPFYEALGLTIADARSRAGLNQAQLAARLRPPVTRACINNIEGARQRVLVHMLVQIAEACGVSAAELLPRFRPGESGSK